MPSPVNSVSASLEERSLCTHGVHWYDLCISYLEKRSPCNSEPRRPVSWNSSLTLGSHGLGNYFIQSLHPLLLLPVILACKYKLPFWCDYGESSFPPPSFDSSGQAGPDFVPMLFASNNHSARFKGILRGRKQDSRRYPQLLKADIRLSFDGSRSRFNLEGTLPWLQVWWDSKHSQHRGLGELSSLVFVTNLLTSCPSTKNEGKDLPCDLRWLTPYALVPEIQVQSLNTNSSKEPEQSAPSLPGQLFQTPQLLRCTTLLKICTIILELLWSHAWWDQYDMKSPFQAALVMK